MSRSDYSAKASKLHLEQAKRVSESFLSPDAPKEKKKKKASRWGDADQKVIIPGMPTILPTNLTEEQNKIYLKHLRIEEISRKLKVADFGISPNPEDRSPSPEPEYGRDGKRINTREARYKKKIEDERHRLILENQMINPDYKAPMDYRLPQQRYQERVMIPTELPPNTNFIGLIIGPRGNSLKELEKKTTTKIMIRGKGSSKEGKLGKDGQPMPGEDEPLHALVSGNDLSNVSKAVKIIRDIIEDAIKNPGNDNELKKTQLTELAKLNGTLKFEDMIKCRNCGSIDHSTWDCREQKNVTANIRCSNCGGMGHISIDCKATAFTPQPLTNMEQEYQSFRAQVDQDIGLQNQTPVDPSLPPQSTDSPDAYAPQSQTGEERKEFGGARDRDRGMRWHRGRGRSGPGRGDHGGYRHVPYGYTGGYEGASHRPSGPHSAVPPPNSITSQDNPGGLTLYDASTQPRKREWEDQGYASYGHPSYRPDWQEGREGYHNQSHYPGADTTRPTYQDSSYLAYQPPPPGHQPQPQPGTEQSNYSAAYQSNWSSQNPNPPPPGGSYPSTTPTSQPQSQPQPQSQSQYPPQQSHPYYQYQNTSGSYAEYPQTAAYPPPQQQGYSSTQGYDSAVQQQQQQHGMGYADSQTAPQTSAAQGPPVTTSTHKEPTITLATAAPPLRQAGNDDGRVYNYGAWNQSQTPAAAGTGTGGQGGYSSQRGGSYPTS